MASRPPDSTDPDAPAERDRRGEQARGAARDYARYSGIAIQMIAILLIGAYAGRWLDAHFATATPYFTIGVTLLAIALALYLPLRGLMK